MATYRRMLGEQYANGRMTFRSGGRFTTAPSLEELGVTTCPSCRIFIVKVVKPTYYQGFVDPMSMRPQMPHNCHRCGMPFDRDGMQSAINELMVLG